MFPATMRPSPLLRAAVLAAGLLLVPPAVWSKSAKEVFRQAAPSVVVVLALGRDGATTGQGSGVVVGRTEVVTNCHVVEDAAGIAVRQASDHTGETTWRMEASVLARNDERDLCLLHVDQLSDPPAPSTARLGSAKTLSVGEEVYAIGAPRGLELSLSRGIVSQLRGVMGKRRDPLIQTDAAISPGSSGGGLFNANGELVGITTFKRRGENLNFALPADWVRELRERGRSALDAAKLRAECEEDPDFDCLVALARRDADSTRVRDAALSSVVQALMNIASVQAKAGNTANTLKFIKLARHDANSIDSALLRDSTLSISIRQDRLMKIASALANTGKVASALKIAQEIDDAGHRSWTLKKIVVTQANTGNVAAALETAQKIDDAGWRSSTLRDIAAIQANAGNVSGALKTTQEIGAAKDRAWALTRIAAAQANTGNVSGALKTAQEIDDAEYRALALSDIAAAQANAGNQQEARKTLADALNTARGIDGAQSRASALREVAVAQVKAGERQGARKTLAVALNNAQEIDEAKDRVSALTRIAATQAEAGEQQETKKTLTDALKAAQEIDDAWLRRWSLTGIAVAQAKAGNLADALKTTQEISDAEYRASALSDIAVAQAKAGEQQAARKTLAVALNTAQKIDEAWQHRRSLTEIAVAQAKAGNLASALKTTQEISDAEYRASALSDIAVAQANAGDQQEAKKTMAAALNTARGIDGAQSRASALREVAVAQVKAGERQGATRTFAVAFDAARDIDTSWGRLEAFTGILSAQATTENAKDVINAFKNAVRVQGARPSEATLRLDRSERVLVQRGLASLGKDAGAADGVFGPRTRAALRSWQVDAGFKSTGHLTREQADRLIAAGRAAEPASQRLKEFCTEVPQSALCRDL